MSKAIATLLGGALGMAAHIVANLTSDKVEVVLIFLSIGVIGKYIQIIIVQLEKRCNNCLKFAAAVVTFCRFSPNLGRGTIMGFWCSS